MKPDAVFEPQYPIQNLADVFRTVVPSIQRLGDRFFSLAHERAFHGTRKKLTVDSRFQTLPTYSDLF